MRPHILVAYPFAATTVEACAWQVLRALGDAGAEVELADCARPPDATAYDGIVLGLAVEPGDSQRMLRAFTRENGVSLAAIPFAVFGVRSEGAPASDAHFAAEVWASFEFAPESIRVFSTQALHELQAAAWARSLGFHRLTADAACPFSTRGDRVDHLAPPA